MTRWLLVLAVPVIVLLALIEAWRRHRERQSRPDYVQRIGVLTPDNPMKLPKVRPLKATRAPRTRRPKLHRVS